MHPSISGRSAGAAALALLVTAVACGGPSAPVAAPVPVREVGGFVVRLGVDTVAVEQFSRGQARFEGRQVLRTPRTSVREYAATLGPDGAVTAFELSIRPAPGAEPTMTAEMEIRANTAVVSITRGDSTETLRVPATGHILPLVGYSLALYEIPLVRLRQGGQARIVGTLVPIGAREGWDFSVELTHPDSAVIHNIAGENRVRVDVDGRLLAWDGTGSTLQLVAERATALDLDRFAADFAARDAAGRSLGTLSPRDTVQAAVAGANISIDYSRPLARGRQIFGGVVPWDEVWRTGANQATHFRTDRELVVGGSSIPAGTYTLFSLPSPTGWQLIINRQTGQWGTVYDPQQDLARVPLRTETLAQPVEQFTISIEPAEGGGSLRLAWGDTAASVPIRVP